MRVPGRDGLVPLVERREGRRRQRSGADRPYDRSRNINIESRTRRPAARRSCQRRSTSCRRSCNLPAGIKKIDSGDGERMKELFGSFGLAMADRRPVRVHGARAAVQGLPAADHDSRGAAAVGGRRVSRAPAVSSAHVDAGVDRAADADGHHDQELDPARRVRDRRDARTRHGTRPTHCSMRAANARGRS